MKTVTAIPMPTNSKQEALEVVEKLRDAIEEGRIVGFVAVGIASDDSTEGFLGTVQRVSRLRTLGAIEHLKMCFAAGDI